jgi:hypothetical protein
MIGRADTDWFGTATEPVVLAVTVTPLLNQTLAIALKGVAVLGHIPAGITDLAGLIRHIRPDALIVDSDDRAHELAPAAAECSMPLVHVSLQTQELRVFRNERWTSCPSWGTSPNTIRNVVIGEIYASSVRRRVGVGESDAR